MQLREEINAVAYASKYNLPMVMRSPRKMNHPTSSRARMANMMKTAKGDVDYELCGGAKTSTRILTERGKKLEEPTFGGCVKELQELRPSLESLP
jgi:hypothetical protein